MRERSTPHTLYGVWEGGKIVQGAWQAQKQLHGMSSTSSGHWNREQVSYRQERDLLLCQTPQILHDTRNRSASLHELPIDNHAHQGNGMLDLPTVSKRPRPNQNKRVCVKTNSGRRHRERRPPAIHKPRSSSRGRARPSPIRRKPARLDLEVSRQSHHARARRASAPQQGIHFV
jgi:hypothetical protein